MKRSDLLSLMSNVVLNRDTGFKLSTAPRQFLTFLAYKAEEAGTKNVELNSKKLKASQTCAKCGHKTTRDRNSAMVMWNEGFKFYNGVERSACAGRKVS